MMVTETVGSVGAAVETAQAGGQSPGSVLVYCVARHKYDGTLYLPGQSYQMDAHRVVRNVQAGLVWAPSEAEPCDWWGREGRVFAPEAAAPVAPRCMVPSAGSLKVLIGVGYDPGSAVYRMHDAINETTQHASAMVRWGDSNPHVSFRQYDGDADLPAVRALTYDADVLYCHVGYWLLNNTGLRPREGQILIRHYHGSRPNSSYMEQRLDEMQGALIFGARLTHLEEWDRVEWMPIPIPVDRYRALVPAERVPGPFRVAHSPTRRSYKGTDAFLSACSALKALGVAIEPVLIEGKPHIEALKIKAACDAVFDSFWLGIQGSGLEGAAMGLPVIAGDESVAKLYRRHVGYVPYTYANREKELIDVLERLATDEDWLAEEAHRVNTYVRELHDYAAVSARFEGILARAMNRPEVLTPKGEPVRTPEAERVTMPGKRKPKTQKPAPTVTR